MSLPRGFCFDDDHLGVRMSLGSGIHAFIASFYLKKKKSLGNKCFFVLISNNNDDVLRQKNSWVVE